MSKLSKSAKALARVETCRTAANPRKSPRQGPRLNSYVRSRAYQALLRSIADLMNVIKAPA